MAASQSALTVIGQRPELVLGGSGPISISVTSGSIWPSADMAVQARGNFNITVDATYLKPGNYSGALSLTCQVAYIPFNLQVNVTVTSNGGLVFSPSALTITSYQGRFPVSSDNSTAIIYTLDPTTLPNWLAVSSDRLTTPATLTFSVPSPPTHQASANVK